MNLLMFLQDLTGQKWETHRMKDILSRDSTSSMTPIMENRSTGLIQAGKLLSGTSSTMNIDLAKSKLHDIPKTEMNIRIRGTSLLFHLNISFQNLSGKGSTATAKGFLERSVDEQKRLEERRKDQLRALERMEDFEKLKRHHEQKLQLKLEQLSFDRELNSGPMSTSTSKQSAYRSKQLDSAYNPYSVSFEFFITEDLFEIRYELK